jgi:hypothetical protein
VISSLLSAYRKLPRAGKWLVAFAGFCIAYFAVIDPIMAHTAEVRSRADTLEADAARDRALADAESDDGRALAAGVSNFGAPLVPSDRANRAESFRSAVDAVLERHGVTNSTQTERESAFGSAAQIETVAGPGARVRRVALELTFEATPEAVVAVIADLERTPGVAAVGRVRIDRAATAARFGFEEESTEDPTRLVRATVVPEAWVIDRGRGGAAQ